MSETKNDEKEKLTNDKSDPVTDTNDDPIKKTEEKVLELPKTPPPTISDDAVPSCSNTVEDSPSKDALFEPTVDMMVNDFDDEQTLEEEENLAAKEQEDPTAELSSLQQESEMPIEQLMALYNCGPPAGSSYGGGSSSGASNRKRRRNRNDKPVVITPTTSPTTSTIKVPCKKPPSDVKDLPEKDPPAVVEDAELDDDDDEMATTTTTTTTTNLENQSNDQDFDDEEPSELNKLYTEDYEKGKEHITGKMLMEIDEDDDMDYAPNNDDEDAKKIMVGSDYQAQIPESFPCKYDDVLPYENEDKLLWDPTKLSDIDLEDYLNKFSTLLRSQTPTNGNNCLTYLSTGGKHLRDDEQALFLLLQCGYNCEEAIRRRRINSTPEHPMSLWSEEECRNFENGMRLHGKSFHEIQQSKVKTRSVGECVQFYYLWKKTERHDAYTHKQRLEKKKYHLNPSVTDYMDKYLEEHESNGGATSGNRDRSVSPNVNNCLLLGVHHKRPENTDKVDVSKLTKQIKEDKDKDEPVPVETVSSVEVKSE